VARACTPTSARGPSISRAAQSPFLSFSVSLLSLLSSPLLDFEEGKEQFCDHGLYRVCTSGVVETVWHVLVSVMGQGLREWKE
jgi:hypothetical protein